MNSFYVGEEFALQQLNDFNQWISAKHKHFIGYPCNAVFKLNKFFQWWVKSSLSQSPLNDVGDPNTKSSYTLNAHSFERIVIKFFAKLYSLKSHWGYITFGGTQGNEQGLYMGRCVLEKHGRPILYFSEEAHYSIASLGKVLGLDSCVIRSTSNGEMDYSDLEQKLNATRPALFSLSIGTTFKGAIDRIEIIQSIVRDKGIKHAFYHADAALFGGYLPFYKSRTKPNLNFKKYPYDSIAVSGHKFFGSPTPLGIFLIRKAHAKDIKTEYIEYLHTYNMTIPCSRSALNTLILWWIITTTPKEEFVKEANQILKNARYFYEELRKRQYPAWLNDHSNTLFFQAPSPDLCERWTLSLQTYPKFGLLAHAIVMQHVDKEMINEFLHDLDQEKSRRIQMAS